MLKYARPTSLLGSLCGRRLCTRSVQQGDGSTGRVSSSQAEEAGQASPEREDIRLWACYREGGVGKTQVLRNAGMVPGLITDFDPSTGIVTNEKISLQRKEVWSYLTSMGRKGFVSRFYSLEIHHTPDSEEIAEKVRVYPDKLTLINGYRAIKCAAFVKVRAGVMLKSNVPFRFRGRSVCPGLLSGGTFVAVKESVSCYFPFEEIPPYIEVDISNLNVGDKIWVGDLDLQLQFEGQASQVVCGVKKRKPRNEGVNTEPLFLS